jgi:isopenicillin N synthase-like dioxygenase
MKASINDLKTKGFVALAYPTDLRAAVDTTVAAWKQFCALPPEVKKGLPYSNNADGVGYELKEGVGAKADRKENFDVAIAGHEWLQQNIEQIQNPVALDFVQNATALVGIMKPIVLDFARQAEQAFDLEGFSDEVDQSENAFFVRFIHYFGDRAVGDETASAHADQSGFTLHLYESAPGLQCLPYDGDWIDMPVSAGETVIIPSMQMQLRSKGKLRALCHRVVATAETAAGGRYSAVCFVQLKNTKKYDKDANGRLQEKIPGFNYGLGHDEFAKLFK